MLSRDMNLYKRACTFTGIFFSEAEPGSLDPVSH